MASFYKPTLQTKFNNEGNCLAACIATLFDVSIDDVPSDLDDDIWHFQISEWFSVTLNKFMLLITLDSSGVVALLNHSLCIVAINSPNPLVERHVVICQDELIVFDPMVGEVSNPLLSSMEPTYLIIADIQMK